MEVENTSEVEGLRVVGEGIEREALHGGGFVQRMPSSCGIEGVCLCAWLAKKQNPHNTVS